jgi:hypothetical protein
MIGLRSGVVVISDSVVLVDSLSKKESLKTTHPSQIIRPLLTKRG